MSQGRLINLILDKIFILISKIIKNNFKPQTDQHIKQKIEEIINQGIIIQEKEEGKPTDFLGIQIIKYLKEKRNQVGIGNNMRKKKKEIQSKFNKNIKNRKNLKNSSHKKNNKKMKILKILKKKMTGMKIFKKIKTSMKKKV